MKWIWSLHNTKTPSYVAKMWQPGIVGFSVITGSLHYYLELTAYFV